MQRYYAWLLVVTAMVITNVTYGFYDPNLQRWINRDPINEVGFLNTNGKNQGWREKLELNLYAFLINNAVNKVDLFGLLMADRYEEVAKDLYNEFPGMQFPAGPGGTPQMYEPGINTADGDFSALLPAKCNLFAKGRKVFPTRGLLNQRNPFLRIGWGWRGTEETGRDVFRIAWGESGRHINLWPPTIFW